MPQFTLSPYYFLFLLCMVFCRISPGSSSFFLVRKHIVFLAFFDTKVLSVFPNDIVLTLYIFVVVFFIFDVTHTAFFRLHISLKLKFFMLASSHLAKDTLDLMLYCYAINSLCYTFTIFFLYIISDMGHGKLPSFSG